MFCDYKGNQKGWLSTENQPNFLACVRVREKNKVYRTVIILYHIPSYTKVAGYIFYGIAHPKQVQHITRKPIIAVR